MPKPKTKEAQNQFQFDHYRGKGPVGLGPWSSHSWRDDPKHIGFTLARYKFCAKMLHGKKEVLEIGCGDAFGTPIILESARRIHAVDFEPLIVADARARYRKEGMGPITFSVEDLTVRPVPGSFDAVYSLDVLEHIPQRKESRFMNNIVASLKPDAVCILGTPNKEARRFASKASQEGHVNLKTAQTLRMLLMRYFKNALIFSMNDEIVHTGYYPMAHYLLGMGVGLRALS